MLYIFDTDHLSLYARNHPIVIKRILEHQITLTTTAINIEEQLRGRLAQVAEAKDGIKQSNAYQRLVETVILLSEFNILQFDAKAQKNYQIFKEQRIRVGTQDLRIGAIRRSLPLHDRSY